MNKFIFLIFTLLVSTSVAFAQDGITGAPGEKCNCNNENTVQEVIQAMSKTDTIVPIHLYYKFVKLGSANLNITHVDGKILSVTIKGRISAFGFKDSMVETIDIESLQTGKGLSYYSNDNETPIVKVNPKAIKVDGGQVDLVVKMNRGHKTIPLTISRVNDRFIAEANGSKINSLKIYLGFDYGDSIDQQNIVGGHVSKYRIN